MIDDDLDFLEVLQIGLLNESCDVKVASSSHNNLNGFQVDRGRFLSTHINLQTNHLYLNLYPAYSSVVSLDYSCNVYSVPEL